MLLLLLFYLYNYINNNYIKIIYEYIYINIYILKNYKIHNSL